MKKEYVIATIPGDGIGPEVVGETRKVLDVLIEQGDFSFVWKEFPCSGEHYLATGETLTETMLEAMKKCHAILLGAIGDYRVKPGVLERGILLTLRFALDQYINLRPARSFPRTPLPVNIPEGVGIDVLVVRENTEDFYMGLGASGEKTIAWDFETPRGLYNLRGDISLEFDSAIKGACQIGIATEPGIRRAAAWACEAAKKRKENKVVLASKANALPQLYGFWEEVAADEIGKHGLQYEAVNVDALCYHLVRTPQHYGVILTPNMFGDIVSDLLGAIAGGLGVAAGANIGEGLSMFEPVHGSAPDIAGTGRASPVAAILSGALLLEHLGLYREARWVETGVESYLGESELQELPVEMGGKACTRAVGDHIASRVRGFVMEHKNGERISP